MLSDRRQFSMQKARAKQRGIEFKLTFDEWLGWWKATGHYHERGKNKGKYVMARKGDSGAYELGNIECITHSRNCKVGNKGRAAMKNSTLPRVSP